MSLGTSGLILTIRLSEVEKTPGYLWRRDSCYSKVHFLMY